LAAILFGLPLRPDVVHGRPQLLLIGGVTVVHSLALEGVAVAAVS
jgi:hypothetical protein